eukprot:scaffold9982_cov95-Isochrysis_galbana.AAC.1
MLGVGQDWGGWKQGGKSWPLLSAWLSLEEPDELAACTNVLWAPERRWRGGAGVSGVIVKSVILRCAAVSAVCGHRARRRR